MLVQQEGVIEAEGQSVCVCVMGVLCEQSTLIASNKGCKISGCS